MSRRETLQLHLTLFKFLEESLLTGHHKEKSVSLSLVSSGTTNSMDISAGVLRKVHLHDPIDSGEVHTTRRNVGAKHNGLFLLHELEVDGRALVLVLLAVEFEQILGNLEALERLVGESDLLSGGEEN